MLIRFVFENRYVSGSETLTIVHIFGHLCLLPYYTVISQLMWHRELWLAGISFKTVLFPAYIICISLQREGGGPGHRPDEGAIIVLTTFFCLSTHLLIRQMGPPKKCLAPGANHFLHVTDYLKTLNFSHVNI